MWFAVIVDLAKFFNIILRMMRVIIDIIQIDISVRQRLVYLFGQRFKLCFGKFIASNVRLVGYYYQRKVYFFQFAYGVNNIVDKFKVVDFMDIVVIDINGVITVKKNCGYVFRYFLQFFNKVCDVSIVCFDL